MSKRTCLAIVLAAGEGTRMRSARPKVLHEVAGRSMLAHVLAAVRGAGTEMAAVVVGPNSDAVADEAKRMLPKAQTFVQSERRGTAHAVLSARAAIEKGADDILVVYGDTPLISAETLKRLRGAIDHHASVAVLGFRPHNPAGYGRLVMNGHRLVAIREERDASDIERKIDLCNGGLMALRGEVALDILGRIDNKNAKGEFYLTDAVTIADGMALELVALETTEDEVLGVDNKAKLAQAEDVMQWRLRDAAMEAGVTMVAPETVYLQRRHQVRPRRDGRAECRVRSGRRGGGQRRHPRVLASGRRACRQGRFGRPVCAVAARRDARREIACRQFRRGEGRRARGRARKRTTSPTSAMAAWERAPTSGPARSSATTMARTSIAPKSARARSSARIRRWWRP